MSVSRVSNATAATAVAGLHMVTPTSVTVGSGTGSVTNQGAVTCSAISSVRINGVFNATYDNYRIMLTCTASTASNSFTQMRFSVNGVDHTGGEYYGSNTLFTGSTTFYNSISGATSGRIGLTHTGQLSSYNHIVEVSSPFKPINTAVTSTGYWNNGTSDGAHYGVFLHNVGVPYDGFNIIPGNGTFTGTIRVYGYNNGGA